MPRQTLPSPEWKSNDWSLARRRFIASRLRKNRNPIGVSLGIEDQKRELEVLKDLRELFLRCYAFLLEVDRSASSAQQRINLIAFCDRNNFTITAVCNLDPATYNRVARHYPGDLDPTGSRISDNALRVAIDRAIEELDPPRRGRPKGTDNIALRQFALGLAHIYHTHTGNVPTRIRDAYATSNPEYGPFKDFVTLILNLLPKVLRSIKSGGRNGPDYLIRLAIDEYHTGRESGDPRRCYLIDEALWLAP
jgi:hypothetical protein